MESVVSTKRANVSMNSEMYSVKEHGNANNVNNRPAKLMPPV